MNERRAGELLQARERAVPRRYRKRSPRCPHHLATNRIARVANLTTHDERSRARQANPTTTCTTNMNLRERTANHRRIRKRTHPSCEPSHPADPWRAGHELPLICKVQGGCVARERSKFGITPRGKLRAHPCSGPAALLYESRPAPAKQPSTPVSFTGYVRLPVANRSGS